MPAYFKPLRRKIGVLTLVMSCLFMAGWIRSQYLQDTVAIARGSWRIDLTSWKGRLWLSYATYDQPRETGFLIDSSRVEMPIDIADLPARQSQLDWRWDCVGFHFSSSTHFRHSMIPYWSIAIPLTLLSLYLLISKPRKPVSAEEPA